MMTCNNCGKKDNVMYINDNHEYECEDCHVDVDVG